MAVCSGPKIKVITNELDFEKVNVLQDYEKKAVLMNESDITAKYVAFTRDKNSIFSIPEREGELQPSETKEISIICHADECRMFTDTINIHIREGHDEEISVKARGKGSTAFCADDLSTIDFGTLFTSRP
jgi:hydrocephalus-inducing protein